MPEKTDKEKVIDVFESEIRSRYELPEELVLNWFIMAVRDYSLDISPLKFDSGSGNFEKISESAINTLGLMMCMYYIKREQSRINKLNNIIGKDIQLNAAGEAKKAVQSEYENLLYEIETKLHKQKVHSFN
jgi:hypothetical protein